MSLAFQFFGAWVATYFVSRVTLYALQSWQARTWLRIGTAHLLSWLAIATIVGFLKAVIGPFSFGAGLAYLVPQLIWAAVDISRRTRVI